MSTTGANGDQQFEELLKSLNEINAAAAPAGAGGEVNPEDDEDDEGEENAAIAAAAAVPVGKKPMTKSVTAIDSEGNEMEAIDATELVKSMHDQLARHDDLLAKSLTPLMQAVVKQGEVIKSLQASLNKIGSEGRGRKSTLTVLETPAGGEIAKSMAAGGKTAGGLPSREEFMAKAEAAWDGGKGKLSGLEFAACDTAFRTGKQLDPSIIKKVLA